MRKITLKVNTLGRKCSFVPISIDIDFGEYLRSSEKFAPSQIRMKDIKTGRNIPCQFSPFDLGNLRGTLSWILLTEAQKQFMVTVSEVWRQSQCSNLEGVWIHDRGDAQIEIFVNREHITNYVYNEAYERTFLYPLIGPDGLNVTRSIPCFGDHLHHKGIGLAIGEVSDKKGKPGINFWGLGTIGDSSQGRVIHRRFTKLEAGPVFAKIEEENDWKQNDEFRGVSSKYGVLETALLEEMGKLEIKNEGIILIKEKRTLTIWNIPSSRIIDICTVMKPGRDEIVMNEDTEKKEMGKENGPLTIRVADNMRGIVQGMIVNSEGGRKERECWGRQAKWVDYYGPVVPGGPVNGIAAMDHPMNIRHPTGWQVRDYGLFAANPFYSKKPEWPDQGPICLSKFNNEKLELRYRIYIHKGDEKNGMVEQKWHEWVNPPEVVIK